MADQPLPFNTAKLALTVQGKDLDVIAMEGTEALSSVFQFQVDALVDPFFDHGTSLNTPARLSLTGVDGRRRIPCVSIVDASKIHEVRIMSQHFTAEYKLNIVKKALARRADETITAISKQHRCLDCNCNWDYKGNYKNE